MTALNGSFDGSIANSAPPYRPSDRDSSSAPANDSVHTSGIRLSAEQAQIIQAVQSPVAIFSNNLDLVHFNGYLTAVLYPQHLTCHSKIDVPVVFNKELAETAFTRWFSTATERHTSATFPADTTSSDRYIGQLPFTGSVAVRAYLCSIKGTAAGSEQLWLMNVHPLPEQLVLNALALVADRFKLSRVEWETAALMVRGLSNKQISSARNVSTETVKKQVQSVLLKLSLQNRSALPHTVLCLSAMIPDT